MKLLNELISVRRIEDDNDTASKQHAGRDFYEPPMSTHDKEACPHCNCAPCVCDPGEQDDLPNWSSWEREENEEKDDAYTEGSDAFTAGKGPEANPFFRGTASRREWAEGWNDAKEIANEENEEEPSDPREQGWKAFFDGADRRENPHPDNSEESYGWDIGWLEASEQQERDAIHHQRWEQEASDAAHLGHENEEGSSAYDQGYAAYQQGRGLESNPHPYRSTEYTDWQHAWMDARDEETESARGGREEDEESAGFVVYFDATGAGRGPEPIAGPFATEQEAQQWIEFNGYANDENVFIDADHNDEEYDGDNMTDVEADADTLRNVGWGTDEDYGHYEDEGVDAVAEGEKAYHDGLEMEDNPYAIRSRAYEQWARGWERASRGQAARRGNYDYEDEGEVETGLGAYDQQGAHMGGEKQTDTDQFELNPDSADDLDLGDDQQPEGGEEGDPEGDVKLDAMTDKASEDPDRQGVIRTVKGAHLVYKRQTPEGTYEELWVYNTGNMRDELSIRKAVLAGTDIPTTKTVSPDGAQEFEIWTMGNAEVLQIKGLPN